MLLPFIQNNLSRASVSPHMGCESAGSPLSDTSCVVAFITVAQSNIIGTNSYVTDAGVREWGITIPDAFIWDQIKRATLKTHAYQDTDVPHLNEYSEFRPLTVGYGRSSDQYPWDTGTAEGPTDYGIGMEMQLAHRLRLHYRRPVYIIKVGVGGTGVTDLGAGVDDWNIAGLDTKPESLLELARDYYWGAGLNALLTTEGYDRADIHLAGVFSMIGATDSNGSVNYLTYEADLTACIAEVRSWINPGTPTDVPWILVRSESYFDSSGAVTNGHTRIAEIRASQEAIVAAGTNIRLANSDECRRENDGAGEHILGQGQIVLGNEAASQAIQFTPMASPEGEVVPT